MKLRNILVAAVLLAGSAAGLAVAGSVGAAGAVASTNPTVSVLAIDREGNLVPVTASIASAASDAFQVTVTDGCGPSTPTASSAT
jgi:hypothetical protein